INHLVPGFVIGSGCERRRETTGAEDRLELCHRTDIGLIVMLARTHHGVELADRLTPVLLTHGRSNPQGAQSHQVRDPKALWELPPFVDLAQTKKPPVNLNGLLPAHIFHPARRDPAPRTDWIPIEFHRIFCVSHVCYLLSGQLCGVTICLPGGIAPHVPGSGTGETILAKRLAGMDKNVSRVSIRTEMFLPYRSSLSKNAC